MRSLTVRVACAVVALHGTLLTAATAAASPIFPNETLDYNVNWPTGLSLGEAHWKAHNSGTALAPIWEFEFNFDARLPGFALIDTYRSTSNAGYCTEKLTRDLQHGSKKVTESETVDPKALTVLRKTTSNSGGESTLTVAECVKDALTFLFLTRRELLSGRIPPVQQVMLGSLYEVRLTYLGTKKERVGDRTLDVDRVGCAIKGPASNANAEIEFARDAVRTPIAVRIPLTLGTFSLELAR